jgi:hypothetical protein
MSPQNESPCVAPGLVVEDDFLSRKHSDDAPKAQVSQAKIWLLTDDIVDTAGWLVAQLSVLPSQSEAGDVSGLIYTLRRSRCYWRHISEVARELAEANDARLSAIRQAEANQ